MTRLAKNFWREEFACKCGCGFDTVDIELVATLQTLRDKFNNPVTVHSGCRCEEYNKQVLGSKNSQHKVGRAADIVVQGVSPLEVFLYLEGELKGWGGLGLYDTFVHVDTRSNGPARWDET